MLKTTYRTLIGIALISGMTGGWLSSVILHSQPWRKTLIRTLGQTFSKRTFAVSEVCPRERIA